MDSETKVFIQTVITAMEGHFQELRRVQFEYEVEIRQLLIGPTQGQKSRFQGAVYWKPGHIRYDAHNLDVEGLAAENSAIRTPELVAHTQWTAHSGPMLVIGQPVSDEHWYSSGPGDLPFLNPEAHFFGQERPPRGKFGLAQGLQQADSARHEYEGELHRLVTMYSVVYPATAPQIKTKVTSTFDEKAEFLPVSHTSAEERNGTYVTTHKRNIEWQRHGAHWYPSRATVDQLVRDTAGNEHWLRYRDVNIKAVRLNDEAKFTDSVFDPGTAKLPERAWGIDQRPAKPLLLVVEQGKFRPLREGEAVVPPENVKQELNRLKEQEEAARRAAIEAAKRKRLIAWSISILAGSVLGLIAYVLLRSRKKPVARRTGA